MTVVVSTRGAHGRAGVVRLSLTAVERHFIMSKLRLWGHPKSINVQKVLWALDELGLEYERIDAGGPFGRVKDADYLTLNPNGLIPTLEDGSDALWD